MFGMTWDSLYLRCRGKRMDRKAKQDLSTVNTSRYYIIMLYSIIKPHGPPSPLAQSLFPNKKVPRVGRERGCLWLFFSLPFVLKFPLLYWLVLVISCVC